MCVERKDCGTFFRRDFSGRVFGIGAAAAGLSPAGALAAQPVPGQAAGAVRLGVGDRTSQAQNYHPLPHCQTAHPCRPADASLDVTGHGTNSAKVRAGTSLFPSGLRPWCARRPDGTSAASLEVEPPVVETLRIWCASGSCMVWWARTHLILHLLFFWQFSI